MKNRNGPKSKLQVESVVNGGQGGRSMWVSRFGKVYQAVGGKWEMLFHISSHDFLWKSGAHTGELFFWLMKYPGDIDLG